jgi:hypothetical protein
MARKVKADAADERKEFTVRGTTISDEDGKRCPAGSVIMLGAALAQKFHDLGYLDIPLGEMYKDDQNAYIAALTAELATVKANYQALLDANAATEIGRADAGNSAEGASEPDADSSGGEPASGSVAAGADAPKNPRRKRSGQL